MAKRNQYNRLDFSQNITFEKDVTAQDVTFVGDFNTSFSGTAKTGAVTNGNTVVVTHNARFSGKITLEDVSLTPGQSCTVRVQNSSIPFSEVWHCFPQLQGATGSYTNVAAMPNSGLFEIRVVSMMDTLTNAPVEVSYLLIRTGT